MELKQPEVKDRFTPKEKLEAIINDWERRKNRTLDEKAIPSPPLDCKSIHFFVWTVFDLLRMAQKTGGTIDVDLKERAENLLDESKTIACPKGNNLILSDRYFSWKQAEVNDQKQGTY